MNKKFCALIMIFGLLISAVALPMGVGAVDVFHCNQFNGDQTDVCGESFTNAHGSNPLTHTIKVVLDILTIIVGITAVVMLIFSGLKMIWAQGDEQAVKSAREGIIGSAVGIAIAALAQAIVLFVLNRIQT